MNKQEKINQVFETNLRNYVNSLRNTSIGFVFMTTTDIILKTNVKHLGNNYYLTDSPNTRDYYIYIYKTSDVKYFMTRYQENTDHVRILNFRLASKEEKEDEEGTRNPYIANHGDHLTFGLRKPNPGQKNKRLRIDTHQTIYTFATNAHSIGYFDKALIGDFDACVFDFEPIVNKKYDTFVMQPCSTQTTLDKAYKNPIEKRILFHLVNKMANVDVPIFPKEKEKEKKEKKDIIGGTQTNLFFEYKGIHFQNDDFLNFIRPFFAPLNQFHVTVSLFYDTARKNMICFIDFEERGRIGLIFYMPKALKACYAHKNDHLCSKRDRRTLATFTQIFQEKIEKIKKFA